ncbi:MAG: hypothetical protein PHI03_13570 [Bacteroidales bacterium]|nr:hypothetical protein [Bacteroidales bacterium]
MEVLETPFLYAHVENPMPIKLKKTTADELIFHIEIQGKKHYFSCFPVWNATENAWIITFELASFLKPIFDDKSIMFVGYDFTLNAENSVVGYAVRGGISKREFMQLKKMDSEIFSYRLLSAERQFLLTTRTQSSTINIKRGELRYIYFFRDPNNDITFSASGLTPQLFAADSFNLVCFDLVQWKGATTVNQITITKATHTTTINIIDSEVDNKILLMFRNSLGVFEHIELTGKGNTDPNIQTEEYGQYNEDYGDFSQLNRRGISKEFIEAESGYKNFDELNFIKDLLMSDEIYLITGNEELPCRVSTSNFKIPLTINTPQSVSLRISLADQERNYTDITPVQLGPVPPIIGDGDILLTPSGSAIFAYITV